MCDLPANVYSVAAVRAFDRCAIDREGIAGYTLMSRAGAYTYRCLVEAWPDTQAAVVVCGGGNNAGDGYVIARLAQADKRLAAVIALTDPATLGGDAATAYEDFVSAGGQVIDYSDDALEGADVVIDALLGSGLERDVEGTFADAVHAVNRHPAPVVAVDLPSGLHGDSGAVMGCAIEANMTVTFVGLKSGLYLGSGPELCGEIHYSGLEIPGHCRDTHKPVLRRVTRGELSSRLPPRRRDAHKGDFGHVLVVGGGPGMPGAARLCAEAALRCGAGRVSVASHPENALAIVASRPEVMVHGVETADDLQALVDRADVVAFGPGLGLTDWSRTMYDVVDACGLPMVWDADALNLLSEHPVRSSGRVITPHPGEAARLLGVETADIQQDRLGSLRALVTEYGGPVVLKGACSLISDESQGDRVCDAGNPGMATAGMGDVLTGVIASLMAQGLLDSDAASNGVLLHALAGDLAAESGERGLLASDLFAGIRSLVNP